MKHFLASWGEKKEKTCRREKKKRKKKFVRLPVYQHIELN